MSAGNVVHLTKRKIGGEERILHETLEIARRLHGLCRDIEASAIPLDRKAQAMSELVIVGNGLKRAFDAVLSRKKDA